MTCTPSHGVGGHCALKLLEHFLSVKVEGTSRETLGRLGGTQRAEHMGPRVSISANPRMPAQRPPWAVGKGPKPPNAFQGISAVRSDSSLPAQNCFHPSPYRHTSAPFPQRPSSHVHKWGAGEESCCRTWSKVFSAIALKSVLTRDCCCSS